jgi:hypothetical protein
MRFGTCIVWVVVVLVVLGGMGHGRLRAADDVFVHPLAFEAWWEDAGKLEFALEMTREEQVAFAQQFWNIQALFAKNGGAHGYLIWVTGSDLKRLQLTAIDAEHQIMVCLSDLPLAPSASEFLRALGCVWPEG